MHRTKLIKDLDNIWLILLVSKNRSVMTVLVVTEKEGGLQLVDKHDVKTFKKLSYSRAWQLVRKLDPTKLSSLNTEHVETILKYAYSVFKSDEFDYTKCYGLMVSLEETEEVHVILDQADDVNCILSNNIGDFMETYKLLKDFGLRILF